VTTPEPRVDLEKGRQLLAAEKRGEWSAWDKWVWRNAEALFDELEEFRRGFASPPMCSDRQNPY
jgi:hypothetical protein